MRPRPVKRSRAMAALVALALCCAWANAAQAEPRARGDRAAQQKEARAAEREARAEKKQPRPRRSVPMQIGGVALAVVGAGLLGTGLVFEVRAESKWGDIEAAADRGGPWTPALQSTYDDARVDQLVGGLALLGGTAIAVLGLVLYAEGAGITADDASTAIDAAQGRWRF